jgi:hypothetical protein
MLTNDPKSSRGAGVLVLCDERRTTTFGWDEEGALRIAGRAQKATVERVKSPVDSHDYGPRHGICSALVKN